MNFTLGDARSGDPPSVALCRPTRSRLNEARRGGKPAALTSSLMDEFRCAVPGPRYRFKMNNYDVIKLSPDEFERLTKLLRTFGHAGLIHPNGAVYLDSLAEPEDCISTHKRE